jgi:hypothetical protein
MGKSYLRAAAGPIAFLVAMLAPEVIGRLRGNYDAQHLFNLLALLLASAHFLHTTRNRPWRPVIAITTAIGAGYGGAIVLLSHWIGRDDRMSSGGLIAFATGSALFAASLYRANEWERSRRATRRAPQANDR